MSKAHADPNQVSAVANIDFYNTFLEEYDASLSSVDYSRLSFICDCIQRYLGETRIHILDLGCGTGWMAPQLSRFGTVTGVDYIPRAIDIARHKYGRCGTFILAELDSHDFGLPNGAYFDVVVSSEVLEHVPMQRQYLAQINRLLVPSGWLFLTTPNGNVWKKYSRVPSFAASLQPIEKWLTTRELRAIVASTGFDIRRHEGLSWYPFRTGVTRHIQRERLLRWSRKLHVDGVYKRLILRDALYQLMAARKSRPRE